MNFQKIEKKWQKKWEQNEIYKTRDSVRGKKNFLLLTEFPYPSGNLHIGHWYAFAAPDVLGRYLRMIGKNVMYPIGFDAFGLPAENAAIKKKINPRDWTEKNIRYMTGQLKSMGAAFDWSRKISTIDPEYYKWTQWIFLKMFERGLAYRAKTLANWCPQCKTVLANEQVIDGKCERCSSEVAQKNLQQWMLKITDYADRLIDDIEGLNWPETTKLAQKNWIGRSEGAIVKFQIKDSKEFIEIFTTRLDTIFGCTYLVVAPEHSIINDLEFGIDNSEDIKKYLEQSRKKTELERKEIKEKTGVELKGLKAINPFNNEELPIFVADYVLSSYGTGAVMAVPAHDERDFEFAKKYNLPIKDVVLPNQTDIKNPSVKSEKETYVDDGILVNSGEFTGLISIEAREKMVKWLEQKKIGGKKTNYKLRDWIISRQRYWGVPIPLIYCEKCGWQPVPEKNLPIKLPNIKNYLPTEEGRSPLAHSEKFAKVKCMKCGGAARRETDTMDTFIDSSWYFIRYTDPKNKNKFADAAKIKKWLPAPMYVGGAEHNTMHLLYSRFFTKVLYDLQLINFNEPFISRRNHGIILGSDNHKMSKSRGNVVDPDDLVEKFGSDCVRMYLCFMGPYDQGGPWSPTGILGIKRFLERVANYYGYYEKSAKKITSSTSGRKARPELHRAIKKVTEDIENFRFNTAISALMILFNEIEKQNELSAADCQMFLKLLAPFAPHLTEELWQQMGNKKSIHLEKWPKYHSKLLQETEFDLIIQINGKFRGIIKVPIDTTEKEAFNLVSKEKQIKTYKKIIFVPKKLINIVI